MGSEVLTFTSNGLSFNYTSQLHSSQTLDLVIADSDGDGVGDLWRLSPSHLSVALSMGGSASSINLDVGEEFALVDTDGDALPDVMVAEMISGSVRPYELEGSLLIAGAALQFPSNGSGQLTAGDVDGDGDDDLVIFASNGSVVGRNNGSAIFDIEPLGPGGLASCPLPYCG